MNSGWKDSRRDNCPTVIPSTSNGTATDLGLFRCEKTPGPCQGHGGFCNINTNVIHDPTFLLQQSKFYKPLVEYFSNRNTVRSDSRCSLKLQCIVILHARLMY